MAVYGPVRHQKNIIWTEAVWTGPSQKKILYGPKLYAVADLEGACVRGVRTPLKFAKHMLYNVY
jgi:hypothetical protein